MHLSCNIRVHYSRSLFVRYDLCHTIGGSTWYFGSSDCAYITISDLLHGRSNTGGSGTGPTNIMLPADVPATVPPLQRASFAAGVRPLATMPRIRSVGSGEHGAQHVRLTGARAHHWLCIFGVRVGVDEAVVDCYDIINDTWTAAESKVNHYRLGAKPCVDPTTSEVYIFGGKIDGGKSTSKIERYDPITRQWTILPVPPLEPPLYKQSPYLLQHERSDYAIVYIPKWCGFLIMGGSQSAKVCNSSLN